MEAWIPEEYECPCTRGDGPKQNNMLAAYNACSLYPRGCSRLVPSRDLHRNVLPRTRGGMVPRCRS